MSTENPPSPHHLPLLGKTALITGASRGIGAAIALDLAKRGATVILTYNSDHSIPQIESLKHQIRQLPHHPSPFTFQADLSDPLGPSTLIQKIRDDPFIHGLEKRPLKIDILVNNAGATSTKPLSEITVQDYEMIYDINVRGTIFMTQAVLPHLPPNSRIINLSSVGARSSFSHHSLYCSSKAALEGLTRSWANELGTNGTTVNCVAPGPIETEMLAQIPESIKNMQREATPLGKRIGTVDDVVGVVGFLAGEESKWVTGQTINVSGGWSMY